jgi:hypothetical protein
MVHHHHGRRRQSRLFNRMPIIGDTLLAESLSLPITTVRAPINLGMQTIIGDIPNYLTTLIEALRAKPRDQDFLARHRV